MVFMVKKKQLGLMFVSLLALAGSLGAVFTKTGRPLIKVRSTQDHYELSLTSSTQITSGASTTLGNPVSFASSGVSGSSISMSKGGYFYNTNAILGIEEINLTVSSGSFQIWYGQKVSGEYTWVSYTTDSSYDLSSICPNYFKVVATSDVVLEEVSVSYYCSDTYSNLSTDVDYSVYINGDEVDGLMDVTPLKEEGESWKEQYKLITDVYAGDVITFKKNSSSITVGASGSGNNLSEISNGYRVVVDTAEDVSLYLKVYDSSYDVWLSGQGTPQSSSSIQNDAILQAWNWSLSNIQSSLSSIAAAGFKAVQISPMQVQKDYYASGSWSDQWWKLYQPVSFSIATGSGDRKNVLGTKAGLISLCEAAEAYGIDIIVDVVANHLGGSSYNSFNSLVSTLEPDIASNYLYHNESSYTNDDSVKANVQYHLGDYPDLQTESKIVQRRALSLLKEYLDCGVKGFRFDAAKHIETPYDSSCQSDFWPTVVNGARRYAKEQGLDMPYCYGEILYLNTSVRNYSQYAPFMSITEAGQAYGVRDAVGNNSSSYVDSGYNTGVGPSKALLWAESHDNYKEGASSGLNELKINEAYAMQASRANTAVMYMARPASSSTAMGAIGTTFYQDDAVRGANEFRNRFIGYSEYVGTTNGCFYNLRGSGANAGSMVVNLTSSSSVTVYPGLSDGTYMDLVSGGYYTVSGGSVTIDFTENVCALVPSVMPECYILGNTAFTGTSESWSTSSGIRMSLTSSNMGEATSISIASGSVIKIYDSVNDDWYGYYQLGTSYSFATLSGTDNIALEEGTYDFYLNNSGEIWISKHVVSTTFTVTFTCDIQTPAGWNPVPSDYSLYIWCSDGSTPLGTWNEVKGNMSVSGTTASIEATISNGLTIDGAIIYFVQNKVTKQSNDMNVSIGSSGSYTITLGMTSWSGNTFNGATCSAN